MKEASLHYCWRHRPTKQQVNRPTAGKCEHVDRNDNCTVPTPPTELFDAPTDRGIRHTDRRWDGWKNRPTTYPTDGAFEPTDRQCNETHRQGGAFDWTHRPSTE